MAILCSDSADKETGIQQRAAKKWFKFRPSAYSEHTLPVLQLKPNSTAGAKHHEAKMEELKSHEDKGTWKIVPLKPGIKSVTSRWVTTDKYGSDGKITRHKARLVAGGFQQEEGLDFEETFASVIKPASSRVLLVLAAVLH